jgi:hypothetical protein
MQKMPGCTELTYPFSYRLAPFMPVFSAVIDPFLRRFLPVFHRLFLPSLSEEFLWNTPYKLRKQ